MPFALIGVSGGTAQRYGIAMSAGSGGIRPLEVDRQRSVGGGSRRRGGAALPLMVRGVPHEVGEDEVDARWVVQPRD